MTDAGGLKGFHFQIVELRKRVFNGTINIVIALHHFQQFIIISMLEISFDYVPTNIKFGERDYTIIKRVT